MGGCGNPQLVRDILDSCKWLASLPVYPLKGAMRMISATIEDYAKGEGVPLSCHHDTIAYLPHSLSEYDGSYFTSAGRSNIPACIPCFDTQTEKKFVSALISDLNSNLIAGLNTDPNLSRSAARPAMYTAMRTGAVEKALFVGGSNAQNLSHAASALGLDVYKITQGGWKLSKENVDKLLPVLQETLAGLPKDTPVVLFCMDNTSFLGLGEDGSMNVISRSVPGDPKFHVKGALVVAPDKALAHSLEQLKRIKTACGSNPVFILTPWPRFAKQSCCRDTGHVNNLPDPDFLPTILRDLTKLRFLLRKTLQTSTVIDSMELIAGNSYSHEKADQVIAAGWALDPVHPTKHIYAKAALNLIEKMAVSSNSTTNSSANSRKRTWSASNRSGQEGASRGDGERGGTYARSSPGSSKTDRSTSRSRQWPDVKRNNNGGDGGGYGGGGGHGGGGGYGSGGGHGYGGGRNDGRTHYDGRYSGGGGGGERNRYHQGDSRHGGGASGSTGPPQRGSYGGSGPGPGFGSGFGVRGGRGGRGRYSSY
jgi:hypothetical protein